MPTALTKEQKEDNKKRSNLKLLHNRITGAWSFGELKTWTDVYKMFGLPTVDDRTLTFPELKAYLQKQKDELEKKIQSAIQEDPRPCSGPVEQSVNQSSQSKSESIDKIADLSTSPELSSDVGKNKEKIELSATNNYGLSVSPNELAFLYWFQKKAASEILSKILGGKRGILLLAGTGIGKTFITAAVHRRLVDQSYEEGRTFSHIPYLYLTRTTVVEQAIRVFEKQFNLGVDNIEITNIEVLRAKAGKLWVKEELKIVDGEEEVFWIWKKNINPCVAYFDESQAAKNSGSKQHKIMCAYTHLPKNNVLVSISATPFTRVSEAKCFAISTHRTLDHLSGFPPGSTLTEDTWPAYASMISAPSAPDEYNEAAIERLMKDLDDYVVRVRGVRPQFNSKNDIQLIDFETKEDRDYYFSAWERYLKELAKRQEQMDAGLPSDNNILVELQKYSIAAEVAKARFLARKMWEGVNSRGRASVCAVKWKATIIKIVMILMEDYGVTREQISLIWGGGQTQLTKKQKAKKKIQSLAARFEAEGMDVNELLSDTKLDEIEDRELIDIPENYKLGQQDLATRQVEIDRFQSGKALYCLYTFNAGGVGLSLHHCDELTEFKCRRKESGYAVEDDIPLVPVRPRENSIALTYNAIEFAQAFGRVPRLTSLSVSEQTVYLLRGTVEEESMYPILSAKLRCISSVIQMKESWECVYTTNIHQRKDTIKAVLDSTKDTKVDDGTELLDGEEGDDE